MQTTHTRPGAWSALLLAGLVLACDTQASIPTGPGAGPSSAAVPASVTFPDLSGPGRIYHFTQLAPPGLDGLDDLGGSALAHASASRYVLYDDGRFALQLHSGYSPDFQWLGSYTEESGSLALRWDANATVPATHPRPELWPGPWEATATLSGGTLVVTHNVRMWMDGFLNGVYVQVD